MASNFRYNTRDHKFIIKEWLATLEAMRAIIFKGYYYLDLIAFGDDPEDVRQAKRYIELITL